MTNIISTSPDTKVIPTQKLPNETTNFYGLTTQLLAGMALEGVGPQVISGTIKGLLSMNPSEFNDMKSLANKATKATGEEVAALQIQLKDRYLEIMSAKIIGSTEKTTVAA